MYPGTHAQTTPDKPAIIMATTGETITHKELDERSNRIAQLMWDAGLRTGDHVAIFAENVPEYFDCYWAAFRSGLYFTTVNRYLTAEEAAYIVNDCGAQVLFTSESLRPVAAEMVSGDMIPNCPTRLMIGENGGDGFESLAETAARFPAERLAEEPRGETMLYSSGTTGRPKGIKRPLSGQSASEPNMLGALLQGVFGFTGEDIYLSPAPLYHSAPLGFTTSVQSLGGTVVVMDKFDPIDSLKFIEQYKVTTSQWVPTMFTRMLKRPEAERTQYDLSTHRLAVHAAAPCPVEVKKQMIEWWGPIIHEYYAGTELNGFCYINSEQWLAHPGSVGTPLVGVLRICDEEGNEVPTGEPGTIYFERDEMPFEYHGDPEKTKEAQHPTNPTWSALGDVGYVDDDGFLYLTDRKSFMIISGGVNIYPQEIEDVMVMHPKIADVAVFGVPNPEFGEEVKAVVQAAEGVAADDALNTELMGWIRDNIAGYKAPRSIDFMDELPRLPTGKLYKRVLRDSYWGNKDSRIV